MGLTHLIKHDFGTIVKDCVVPNLETKDCLKDIPWPFNNK